MFPLALSVQIAFFSGKMKPSLKSPDKQDTWFSMLSGVSWQVLGFFFLALRVKKVIVLILFE